MLGDSDRDPRPTPATMRLIAETDAWFEDRQQRQEADVDRLLAEVYDRQKAEA